MSWSVTALLALLVPCAMAQLSPVRLTVTKIQKAETQRFTEVGVYEDIDGNIQHYKAGESVLQVGDFVHYQIELVLMSPKPMPALRIEWALLVQPADEQEPQVIQGENMGKLDLNSSKSSRFECDTETVHVRTKVQTKQRNAALAQSGNPLGPSDGGIATEILGYSVGVFDGDKLIVADI
jgi:hypothetical protein